MSQIIQNDAKNEFSAVSGWHLSKGEKIFFFKEKQRQLIISILLATFRKSHFAMTIILYNIPRENGLKRFKW